MADFSKEFLIRVRADIQKAVTDMQRLTGEMKTQGKTAAKENDQVSALSGGFRRLAVAAGAYLSVQRAIQALRIADEYKRVQGQIRLATKAQGDYVAVSKELFNIAQRNGTALQATVSLFRGVARGAKELGASRDDVLTVTNAIQQAFAQGGGGAAAQAGALLQLSQLFGSTVVQAQEFNSLLDGAPGLIDAIAAGMGKTNNELIRAVRSGKVLSADVFRSILKQAPQIAESMGEIPGTLDRSTQRLRNNMAQFLGELDQAAGLTKTIQNTLNIASFVLGRQGQQIKEYNSAAERTKRLESDRLELQTRIAELLKEIARLEPQIKPNQAIPVAARLVGHARNELSELQSRLNEVNDELKTLEENQKAAAAATKQTAGVSAEQQKALAESLRDVNGELKTQISLFEAQSKATDQAIDRVFSLAASFDAAAAEISRASASQSRFPGLDIQAEIGKAQRALTSGDLEGAVAGAESARELIVEIARAGTESQSVLNFLLGQAQKIGTQAAEGLAAQEDAKRKRIEQTLADLAARAKELESLKIGFDEPQAVAAGAALRANLQAQFDAAPLEIPVVIKKIGSEAIAGDRIATTQPPGLARGGMFRGRGGIDRNLAWLSDKEYILRPKAVRHYGKNALDQVNAMAAPRFNQGGLADFTGRALAERPRASGGTPVNLYLDGQRFEVAAGDEVVNRMIRSFNREALKRGGRT